MEKLYLDRAEAAAYLTEKGVRTAKGTLQKLATVGGGPDYQKFGNRAIYTASGLDTWVERRLSAPRCTARHGRAPAAKATAE